jgi:hypothetical protein
MIERFMARKEKKDWDFPPEVRAIWDAAPDPQPCPEYRDAPADVFFEHIKKDRCERCLAAYRQLDYESRLICYLRRGRN